MSHSFADAEDFCKVILPIPLVNVAATYAPYAYTMECTTYPTNI